VPRVRRFYFILIYSGEKRMVEYVEKGIDENGNEYSDEYLVDTKLTREQKEIRCILRIAEIACNFPNSEAVIFSEYGFSIDTNYIKNTIKNNPNYINHLIDKLN
jgi:hypothetical protein